MEKPNYFEPRLGMPYRLLDCIQTQACGYKHNVLFVKQNSNLTNFFKNHEDELRDGSMFSTYYNCSRYGGIPPEHIILANKVTGFLAMNDPNMDIRSQDVLENWRQFHQAALANNLNPITLAHLHTINNTDVNPIQVKKNATRENSSTLKAWLQEHKDNPYPSKGEKILLAILTQMSLTQVSTWFANARRRLKKENKIGWIVNEKSENPDSASDSELSEPLTQEYEKPNSNHNTIKKNHIWSIIDMISEPNDCCHENPTS